ncbi:MAG: hypothetical protein FWG34_10305 [Oscillospiraceae bacterium]|nr:hypothetical protein [Oscillospiraceae bacterium]
MSAYNIIAATDESTVVAEYAPPYRTAFEYQSEADLEREFISLLSAQGYEYIQFHNEATLINNLRIQLGLLKKIIKAFCNYHIFGFTGTPIFAVNAGTGGNPLLRTTEQAFGDKLHTYTIVDAINDGNVLPFRIDFINTIKQKEDIIDKNVRAIDVEKAMSAPERIREVVAYILEHFDQKTKRNSFYSLKGQRVAGFNSIFAVSSIPMAKKYYEEFKAQLAEKNKNLAIATIFSYSVNEDDPEDALPDEEFENDKLDKNSRDFLFRRQKRGRRCASWKLWRLLRRL